MSLISCPECDRQVSTAAEACPQCGHPIRAAAPTSSGPTCYACSAPATTRCQSCGKFSCALHLESILVYHGYGHGRGSTYELRCKKCHESVVFQAAMRRRLGVGLFITLMFMMFLFLVVLLAIVVFAR